MRNRVLRLLSTDTARIISLVAAILLLALGGIELGRVVSADLLRAEAESTAITWAATLQTAADEIPSMIAGAAPSARTERLLKDASHLGDVYRFRIWSRDGRLVFTSERFNSIAKPAGIASRYGKRIADSVIAGSPFTRVRTGGEPGVPHDFSVSCIPIRRNGLVIGVVEVYMDQTGDRNLYEKFLLLTEIIIVIAVLLAGGLPAYMVYRKMEAHRAAQAEAMFLAENDSLTGIPNRRRLGEAAKSALSSARRSKTHVAALLLDVDKFKDINDSFGHAAGDEVLRTFAARLRSAIREEDMVARLGGDEFVVLQVGIGQPDGAAHLAERLLNILSKPYDIGGSHLACRASIGIATAPADAEDWDKLLSCADAALYKSKASGRNAACFFEVGMDAAIRDRWRLEADLRRALEANAFQLAFQPLFNFRERNLVGFEALLRWPEGWEPRSPADFIPIAEESGLIVPIGAWVLETACRTASAWTRPLKVAVNLSPVQFRDGDIAAVVKAALLTSGLDPARLELEVTESLWIQNTDSVLAQLGELRSMGISIALDDFGAGYSSLTYLWRFDFDKVKIDRSFVREMNLDPKAEAIVNSIVALGKTLDLTITAEGVETEAQAEMLNDAGCDQAQGYLFGRPLSIPLADALANAEPGSVMRGMGPTP